MQQTTTYKLNKPESTDTFSVSPLNENADKLETQLARLDGADAAETAARTAETAALDQRVTALEVQKIFFGEVAANGNDQTIDLGVTPQAVILKDRHFAGYCILAVRGFPVYSGSTGGSSMMEIVENGFFIKCNTGQYFFDGNRRFNYVAFA